MERDLRSSVVRVLDRRLGTAGTAFFCLPKGFLVTCSHVLSDIPKGSDQLIQLRFSHDDGSKAEELEATVCWEWSSTRDKDDIATLKLVGELPAMAVPLSFGAGRPRLGAAVDSFGFSVHNSEFGMPGQAEFVGMTRELTTGTEVYVVRGDSIARGFSGGPCVLRETGEVLGVVTALTTADREGRWPHGCFVTPAEAVVRLSPALTVGTPPAVQALVKHWKKASEPSDKYVGVSDFGPVSNAEYQFPMLEELTDSFPVLIESLALIQELLTSSEPKLALIVGSPGTGKSRLLAELARAVCQGRHTTILTQQLIPILVTARSYAAALGNSPADHLADSLRRDRFPATRKLLDDANVEQLLSGGRYRFLVMIDGADEVASAPDRKSLFRRIIDDAQELFIAGHLVIVTTRPLFETASPSFKGLYTTYRLKLLEREETSRLVEGTLGELASDFKQIVETTGLISSLDTPLLLNLAMTLFKRRPARFPATIVEVYRSFIELIQEGWTNTPVASNSILDVLASVALDSLNRFDSGDRIDEWLTHVDHALRASIKNRLSVSSGADEEALRTAQAVINFGLQSSGLMHRQADDIGWSHLLLRDYLAALKLRALVRTDEESVQAMLTMRYPDAIRRESLILFVVIESAGTRAERLLLTTRSECGDFPLALALFLKDCLHRGATFTPQFLESLFSAFEERALEDQKNFGGCESLFASDYGAFWHLLTLQRIPQAHVAILRTVKRSDQDRMMSEWPNSARSRHFSPTNLYAGPLASMRAIYPPDD